MFHVFIKKVYLFSIAEKNRIPVINALIQTVAPQENFVYEDNIHNPKIIIKLLITYSFILNPYLLSYLEFVPPNHHNT